MKLLSVDVGIKNLSFCLFDYDIKEKDIKDLKDVKDVKNDKIRILKWRWYSNLRQNKKIFAQVVSFSYAFLAFVFSLYQSMINPVTPITSATGITPTP